MHVSLSDVSRLKRVLDSYCKATRIHINSEKSCLVLNNLFEVETKSFLNIILAYKEGIEEGIKYLGFYINHIGIERRIGDGLTVNWKKGFLLGLTELCPKVVTLYYLN
jgi:hypothetical protein